MIGRVGGGVSWNGVPLRVVAESKLIGFYVLLPANSICRGVSINIGCRDAMCSV